MNPLKSNKNGKLIGRIILGNFLSLPFPKLLRYIRDVESTKLFQNLLAQKMITILRIGEQYERGTRAKASPKQDAAKRWNEKELLENPYSVHHHPQSKDCLGRIHNRKGKWVLQYSNPCLMKNYQVSRVMFNASCRAAQTRNKKYACPPKTPDIAPIQLDDKQQQRKNLNCNDMKLETKRLCHRLRRISTRNRLTDAVIRAILNIQSEYLKTGDILQLKPFSQKALASTLRQNREIGFKTDISCVSRLVNTLSVLSPMGELLTLKFFLPSRKSITKLVLEELFSREQTEIETGARQRHEAYRDHELREVLQKYIGIVYSTASIKKYRQEMGMPSWTKRYTQRTRSTYPGISVRFSQEYLLTPASIRQTTSSIAGVYELRLSSTELEYPKCRSRVFYIGSGTNIRKRLVDHLSRNGKNRKIRDFINAHPCSFQFIRLKKDWRTEEKRLYDLFIETFGSSPACNKISP